MNLIHGIYITDTKTSSSDITTTDAISFFDSTGSEDELTIQNSPYIEGDQNSPYIEGDTSQAEVSETSQGTIGR